MIKVVILGSGNVATHFAKAFQQANNIELIQIYNHKPESLKKFKNIETTTELDKVKNADFYLVCVNDDKIEKLITALNKPKSIVAHTSGSLSLLNAPCRNAVFYPLQTFSKNKSLSFKNLPICIETEYKKDIHTLKVIVENINAKVYEVNTSQRQELHLVAVFVCNFVNYLYHIGYEICSQKNLPFDILKPLINETADKINYTIPQKAQTGPAIRNDLSTINRHLKQLENSKYKELYRYLTTSIQKTYE
ncbi:Rossmann-like and DUF2520 domain-containing protein [Flavobacterium sp. CS20]|jgi:predicted short-subunit dehydrogenase-like oxidoreductase (DUF2520 family)|uniref:Rossmann-like and DUF2520 domain-containing protein n=1 Tax=Flavobacterium sp. CS20 TaxID=2775246 RepID=UPI001B3A01A2|nr:Rossmann-like and DUF2520 domain-containing protein [Flavobacterium sp. CS20]QTY27631.1 DUF2520 domain-containing protein [Flavobacterium sp. CS20]